MSGTENFNDYPKHPGPTTPRPYYVEIPLETFETMSEELAELRKHELAWDLDKARIKELEAENESLKYSVATLDTDIAMMKRWRKVSEELPEVEEDCGEIFLVAVAVETEKKTKGSYVTSAEFCNGEWYNDSTGNEIEENIEREDYFYRSKITHWMPMPNAPKEEK